MLPRLLTCAAVALTLTACATPPAADEPVRAEGASVTGSNIKRRDVTSGKTVSREEVERASVTGPMRVPGPTN